ncbi:MAG: TlpA disulfide reductase family protein [Flavobacteriales bacterium]
MNELKLWWKKRWVRNVLFLAILAMLFFTDAGKWIRVQVTGITLSAPSDSSQSMDTSSSVYDFPFEIQDRAGNRYLLNHFKGKPLFVNFWASWCVPCLAEFGSLEALQERVPEMEFLFITQESEEAFQAYLSRTGHQFNFYRQRSRLPTHMAHDAIPASFVLNSKGVIVFSHIGAANWNDQNLAEELKAKIH